VPSTAQAAIVFFVIILPGFLAQGGYRLGRAVPEHPQGLVAVARVIAISVVIALVGWKLGGRTIYSYARDGTALTVHETYTWWFAVALVVAPALLGYGGAGARCLRPPPGCLGGSAGSASGCP